VDYLVETPTPHSQKMTQETNNLAADLWALADLLRGDFKQSQYGRVILPSALLRRLECVLESSKSAVLVEAAKVEKIALALTPKTVPPRQG
jgi:type I restriction enzyme M protein